MASYPIQQNDVLAVRVVCWESNDAQLMVNVLHYLVLNIVAGVPTLTDVITQLDLLVRTPYKALNPTNAQYRGVGGTKIWPLPRTMEESINSSAGAGTAGTQAMPLQVSGLIKFQSGLAGRTHRGRIYPGFLWAGFGNNDGTMNGAGATAVATVAGAIPRNWTMVGAGGTAALAQVVYNRVTHAPTVILASPAQTVFATQRRRGQLGRTNLLPF